MLGQAVLEAALVALGVALALGAEEWRQSRQQQRQAATAASAISEELRSNRAAVVQASSYHSALLDSLHTRGARTESPGPAFFRRGFVAPAPVAAAAWQTASETGALEHLPHALVLKLSRAYGSQTRYERQADAVGSLIYGELYRGGAESIAANHRNLGHLIGTFVYRERQLITLYDSTLVAMP